MYGRVTWLTIVWGLPLQSPVAHDHPCGDTVYDLYITQESGVEGGRNDEGNPVRDVIRALRSHSKILVKACGGSRQVMGVNAL